MRVDLTTVRNKLESLKCPVHGVNPVIAIILGKIEVVACCSAFKAQLLLDVQSEIQRLKEDQSKEDR